MALQQTLQYTVELSEVNTTPFALYGAIHCRILAAFEQEYFGIIIPLLVSIR